MTVTETFFSLEVDDMERATAFYTDALGARVMWASPAWSSLGIAGVRIGLFHDPDHAGGNVGLHFVVSDLDTALADVERAGGRVVRAATEVAPGVILAHAADSEGNTFTLRQA